MDSSPVNPYLLFGSTDEFRPADKVKYALRFHLRKEGGRGLRNLSQLIERHYLLRSIEELRRVVYPSDQCPPTPGTGVSHEKQSTGCLHSLFGPVPAEAFPEKHLYAVTIEGDTEGSHDESWDNLCFSASVWRWPMEVLYQRYHLLIALDFGLSAFGVSDKGRVLIDHAPCAIEALLGVLGTTLQTREQEAAAVERWVATHVGEEEREHVLQQVWNPSFEVSIILINVPALEMGTLASPSLNTMRCGTGCGEDASMCYPHLFPADAVPFSVPGCGTRGDGSASPGLIPLMTRCDAKVVLQDKTFLMRLEKVLRMYEDACRSRLVGDWPDKALLTSMEHLVRLVPERSPQCTSLVLLSNADRGGSHDSIPLLESTVRRKNIILSLLFLSETGSIYDARTSPSLSQFLSVVGGFGVHLDCWLSLAAPRLNTDWCRRFSGPRCLAQQLFVQLDIKFPVGLTRLPQNLLNLSAERVYEPLVFYGSDSSLGDFTLRHVNEVSLTLRCVAEARHNQGWSVVMGYDPVGSPHVAHLYARYDHNLRRGKLTVCYVMEISYPVVYRRVWVSGAKPLIDHFVRARYEDRAVTAMLAEAKTGWLTYLVIARSQLDSWIRSEQVALQCLASIEHPCRSLVLDEMRLLSCREGVSAGWSSHCSMRSIGFFIRWEGCVLPFLGDGNRLNMSSALSVVGRATHILRTALQRRHRFLAHDEGDGLFLPTDSGSGRCMVQLFLLHDTPVNDHDCYLAAAFECRFSFFMMDIEDEMCIAAKMIEDVKAEVSAFHGLRVSARETLTLAVEASINDVNARALHISLCTLSPRRLELIFAYSEPPLSSCRRRTTLHGTLGQNVMHPHPPPGQKIRTIQQLTFRCFLTPYVVSPWTLSDAAVFQWAIGATEVWRTFAQPSFSFFISRRVRGGFRLLYCLLQHRAILYARRLCGGCHEVDVFDVLEMPMEARSTGPGPQLLIHRYVRPFELAMSSLYHHELTADIAEDIHVATVLHTFATLSSPTLPAAAADLVPVKENRCGFVQLFPRLELLLPFCLATHAHTITLHSLPSIVGVSDGGLQECVGRLVSLLGDRWATVDAASVHESLRHKLSEMELYGESTDGGEQLFFFMLVPFRCSYMTFLLMPCVGKSAVCARTQGVSVHVLSLDVATLYRGVMRLYGLAEKQQEEEESPSCLDASLLDALENLLTSFSSIYQAWCLLEQQQQGDGRGCCSDVTPQSDQKAVHAQDILRVFSAFPDYQKEVDISHLLYVQSSMIGEHGCGTFLRESLRSLITSKVHSMRLRPLPTHSAVFLPVIEGLQGGTTTTTAATVTDAAQPDSIHGLTTDLVPATIPFLVKVALVFLADPVEEEEEDCVWIVSPAHPVDCARDESMTLWPPFAPETSQRATKWRLVMRFFLKTAPRQLADLSLERCNPPVEVARRILGELLRERQENQTVNTMTPSLFFTTGSSSSTAELSALSRQALPFDELPVGVQGPFNALLSALMESVAQQCLAYCLESAPFVALRHLVTSSATDFSGALSHTGPDSDDVVDAADLRVLSHTSRVVLEAAPTIAGLTELILFAVFPTLASVPCFTVDSFIVEFTQQSRCSCTVDPSQALLHVFTRCLADDLVCVVPGSTTCYMFVPNRDYFASGWLLVHVSDDKLGDARRVSLLFNKRQEDLSVCRKLCKHLRQLIEAKVKEVSQLHLLKQLRDTQKANNELIPYNWGDQFSSPLPPSSSSLFSSSSSSFPAVGRCKREPAVTPSAAFHCRGITALKIPIYYRLQHQCKKVLSRIVSNGSRLELIHIYNREQCFVVADDIQGDVFHYVRLVFLKDTSHPPSLTAPSPPLSPTDHCPLLVVQVFSATKSVLVERPLRKLQDFCFFLALQELQGHLNYVQRKLISAADLLFLQYRRLDPVCVDLLEVSDGGEIDVADVQFAFALVLLSLKENRFKYFEVQDGRNPAVSNFAEYYGLLEEGDGGGGADTCFKEGPKTGSHGTTPYLFDGGEALRFVKVIEGVTDVLVSCALRTVGESRLVVDRFVSKVPEEQHTTGESETTHLRQVDRAVSDAMSQWRFFALTKRFSTLSSRDVAPAMAEIMRHAAGVSFAELSMLRFRRFSLDCIGHAVFPFLIERLVGIFEPFSPICFEVRPGTPPAHLAGFSWRWTEQLQGDPLADCVEVYITCGYQITADSDGVNAEPLKATRAVRVEHPDLSVTGTTVFGHSPLLREHGIELNMTTEPRAVVQVSLEGGVAAALFNLRDSDALLRLMGHVIAEAEQQSDLLHDVMVQRMGIVFPSHLTESVLATFCCGDERKVTRGRRMRIHDETYRRRINHVRFPLRSAVGSDPWTIIMEGLMNRGLFVNGALAVDEAVKVLYNECHQYSLKDCQRIVRGLLRRGVFRMQHTAAVCYAGDFDSIPDDALIGCSFRRHIQTAHVLVESQHWRSGIAESLEQCESLRHSALRGSCVPLAKAVVLLQRRSGYIFGSRVPDFALLRRAQWCPSDDILDPLLPPRSQLDFEYCPSVDAALQSYVRHLQHAFPTARIIDLDASDAAVSSDATLLHRLRCRYGKVVTPEGNEMRFIPHLYYALIPIADTVGARGLTNCSHDEPVSLIEGGLFIVEIGFQVVHFALDVFMVNGKLLSAGTAAQAGTRFKQSLMFGSVLYDFAVSRLLHCVQMYATLLPGQTRTVDALEHLVKYHPQPPHEALNIAAVFHVDEVYMRRLRKLMTVWQPKCLEGSGVRQVIPKQGEVLLREVTRESYHYCGLMVWDSSRLFVLVSTVRDLIACDRRPSGDLYKLALYARRLLLQLLLESALQQRLESAWDRLRTPSCACGDGRDAADLETDRKAFAHDLQALRARSVRVSLAHVMEPLLQLRLDWRAMLTEQCRSISSSFLPDYTLHMIMTSAEEGAGGTLRDDFGTLLLTLAACRSSIECFTVVEFECGPRGAVRSAALYRGANTRSVGSSGGIANANSLSGEEIELVEQTLKLLSGALWYCVSF